MVNMNAVTEHLQAVINTAYDTVHGRGWLPTNTDKADVKALVKMGLAEMVGSYPKLTGKGQAWRD